jgi:plasmid maintenance system antidote protein VapI
VSWKSFAAHLGWTYARLNEVINGRRQVSADSAPVPGEALNFSNGLLAGKHAL